MDAVNETTGGEATGDCGGHAGAAAEFRGLALAALDKLQPVLDRLRSDGPAPDAADQPATCVACPVCAVLAALRGERPELAARLAEHAAGLLAVLRAALDEGAGAAPQDPAPADPGRTRRVQHIPVARG